MAQLVGESVDENTTTSCRDPERVLIGSSVLNEAVHKEIADKARMEKCANVHFPRDNKWAIQENKVMK